MTTDGAHTSCVTRALVLGAKFYHILEGTAPRTPKTCHNEAMWMVCGGVQGPGLFVSTPALLVLLWRRNHLRRHFLFVDQSHLHVWRHDVTRSTVATQV